MKARRNNGDTSDDTPKNRGGGVRKPRPSDVSRHPGRGASEAHTANAKKNLRPRPQWQPGRSGNPSGRPKLLVEISRLDRSYCPDAIEKLAKIMLDSRSKPRDVIAAANVILDRGLGRPTQALVHISPDGDMVDAAPIDVSPLLNTARSRGDAALEAELRRELERIEARKMQERAASEERFANARRARANGEEIDPVTKLLLEVKDDVECPRHATPSRLCGLAW
jgi:hypothetical protein